MKDLQAIEATYTEIASRLDLALEAARQDGNTSAVVWIAKQQQIVVSAFFILAWGQLEVAINDACEVAVRKRNANPDWEERRAWDSHNADDLRAKFEDRAALVLDRQNKVSDGYRRTIRYYGERNRVAHGRSFATGIDLPFVIGDIYQIISQLRT